MCLSFLSSPWTSLTTWTVPFGSAPDGFEVAYLREHGVRVGVAAGEHPQQREGDGLLGHRRVGHGREGEPMRPAMSKGAGGDIV